MTHVPVLLKEVVEALGPQPGSFIIDGTVGAGGHSMALLEKIDPNGTLLGLDLDPEAAKKAAILLTEKSKGSRVVVRNESYAHLPEILAKEELPKADGLVLDLGLSSTQLEESGRGFSFRKDEPLDMRYQPDPETLTAAEVLSRGKEEELADIFFKYGEERRSRQVAKKIVEVRKEKPLRTTKDLVSIIEQSLSSKHSRIHPATRVFQALRIYVNQELKNLEHVLQNINQIVKPKGRVAIISFHSLEDRLVKNHFRLIAKEGGAELITKKPLSPSSDEVEKNPRSRSAKLRAIII